MFGPALVALPYTILLGLHVAPESVEIRRLRPPTSSGWYVSGSESSAGAQGEEKRPSTNESRRPGPAAAMTGCRKQGKPLPEVHSEAVFGAEATVAAVGTASTSRAIMAGIVIP